WFDYGLAAVIGAGKVPVLTLRVTEYLGSGNVHLAAVCALLLIAPPLALLLVNRRLAAAA
ncbi:MAG: ABC transporter permease, partial [Opitutaceae bacterium]